ncbi:spore germination protein [Paenibacillus albicereus]|uniref:Spore germination protein n=1 Tax=Paenibacillus albicereus TaxID=2726185 RepID=A0A6H2H2B0_9BACL|nr:spore germination protein [Paenibacillus albicereus]QJC53556.1 spore germination protein [Paenibacillus albicereus]
MKPTRDGRPKPANSASAASEAEKETSRSLPTLEELRQWFERSDDVAVLRFSPDSKQQQEAGRPSGSDEPDARGEEPQKAPDARRDDSQEGSPDAPLPELTLVYSSSMADPMLLQKVVLPQARAGLPARLPAHASGDRPAGMGAWQELKLPQEPDRHPPLLSWRDYVFRLIFEGDAVLFCENERKAWSISAGVVPGRSPSEAATEVSVRGPKDGFVEQLQTNTALIRYRLRTPGLRCEQMCVGTRSGTKAALLYEADIADPQLVDTIRDQLTRIRADDIVSTRHLQDLLVGRSWSLLPRTSYTGRPDFAAQCLAGGRVVILLDGNPTAIIAPANLFLLMKSAEDAQQNYFFVNFTRLLRYICLLVTCFLPGLYVALAVFHVDQIPFSLLATILNSREGLPLSTIQEMFLALLLIEIFREAGARLPGAIGQTLTVVGGLIIGDAAVRAGLISPVMIVMAAMTFVAGSTLVNQSLTGAVTLIRFYVYAACSALGFFGFMISAISVLVYLTRIQSFGMPYLAPIAPIQFRDLLPGLFILPFRKHPRRAEALRTRKPLK